MENVLKVYLIIMRDNHYRLFIHAMPERSNQEAFKWTCLSSDNKEYPINAEIKIDGTKKIVPNTFESAVISEDFIDSHKIKEISCTSIISWK